MHAFITSDRLENALTYAEYRSLIDALVAAGRTTGPRQSEELFKETSLNLQRMRHLDKTLVLSGEIRQALAELHTTYYWLILTEGWSSDAAHSIPLMEAIASASGGKIETRYLLGNENLDVLDITLLPDDSSLPKLFVVRAETLEKAGSWGPRPLPAESLFRRLQIEAASSEEQRILLHAWYNTDKSRTLQAEFSELLHSLSRTKP